MSCQTSFMNVKKTSSSVCGKAASRLHLHSKLGRLCLRHQEEQAMGFFPPRIVYTWSCWSTGIHRTHLPHLIRIWSTWFCIMLELKNILGSSASRPTQVTIPLLSLQKVSALMKLAFCLTSENRDWRILAGWSTATLDTGRGRT